MGVLTLDIGLVPLGRQERYLPYLWERTPAALPFPAPAPNGCVQAGPAVFCILRFLSLSHSSCFKLLIFSLASCSSRFRALLSAFFLGTVLAVPAVGRQPRGLTLFFNCGRFFFFFFFFLPNLRLVCAILLISSS